MFSGKKIYTYSLYSLYQTYGGNLIFSFMIPIFIILLESLSLHYIQNFLISFFLIIPYCILDWAIILFILFLIEKKKNPYVEMDDDKEDNKEGEGEKEEKDDNSPIKAIMIENIENKKRILFHVNPEIMNISYKYYSLKDDQLVNSKKIRIGPTSLNFTTINNICEECTKNFQISIDKDNYTRWCREIIQTMNKKNNKNKKITILYTIDLYKSDLNNLDNDEDDFKILIE